ncbi:MAG: hypothetical protein V4514_10945 [Pseudomonadota bacterium]|uniref:hypothetical protein n=1 Tax=Phenylobacterium sp. TaxID=1871053 RepID=UPI0025E9C73D|nr:hypothetical protein [Phenylobacterium sp.]MBT9473692.1 hypothetical protein [Phenylobacterium sp.]
MSNTSKSELSLLKHDEAEVVRASHHPALHDLDRKALTETRSRLRELRDTERTLARQKVRETRGKADARGGSFPGTADRPLQRKQVFASALRRVNKQVTRLDAMDARAAHVGAAQRALAMRKTAPAKSHPGAGQTADDGMQAVSSKTGATSVPPAKVGSVSQANKNAQAKRDNR